MEGKFSVAFAILVVIFATGSDAVPNEMFLIGSAYGGSMSYYGGVSESPLSWNAALSFCNAKKMDLPDRTFLSDTDERVQLLHDRLPGFITEHNLGIESNSKFYTQNIRYISSPDERLRCSYAHINGRFIRLNQGFVKNGCNDNFLTFVICQEGSRP